MKKNITATAALITLACAHSISAATIIDSTFANGNGSFEFDSTGTALTGSTATPGLWVGNGDTALTIDISDTIAAIDTVQAATTVATVGSYSLVVSPDPNAAQTNLGGILDTGYAVGASDEFTFSFDWQKTANVLGSASFDMFVFTSSDNTLGGTLTSLVKGTFGSGPAMTAFVTQTYVPGDFTITGASVGQNLWVAFSAGGFTNASNTSRLNIDNLSLTVVPEPSTFLALTAGLGMLAMRRRRA